MKLRSCAIVFALLALTSCTKTMKASSDFVPEAPSVTKSYKSYDWLPPSAEIDKRLQNPILEGRIHKGFDDAFQKRGFKRLTTGTPDFKVTYYMSVEGKMDIGTMNTYYGYAWYGGTGMIMYSQTRSQEYDEGTLILDVIDGPSGLLVWRGIVEAKLTTSLDPNKRQAQINEAAERILERFPPKG